MYFEFHKLVCSRELELEIGKEGNPFEDSINTLLIFREVGDYCMNLFVGMHDG